MTLPEECFSSGMGEVIKHGLIQDKAYYEWLKEHRDAVMARDLTTCRQMVFRSNEIKKAVVEKDPTEQGERAYLNFGHTLGHAVEKLKNFTMLTATVSAGIRELPGSHLKEYFAVKRRRYIKHTWCPLNFDQ